MMTQINWAQIYPWLEAQAPWLGQLSPLFAATCTALALIVIGGALAARVPRLGGFMRFGGNFLLLTVFVLAAMRFVRMDPAFDGQLRAFGLPAQTVTGGETRIPLASDGHYWIAARVNGVRQRFMVDTGATVTAMSASVAEVTGIEPDPLRRPVTVTTANGVVQAQLGRIYTLRFGSIAARDLDVVVIPEAEPGDGGINVVGMNFLSRLKGWRVEEGVLILTPHHPQAAKDPSGADTGAADRGGNS
jgi:aspartyl protease family protein